MSSFGIVVVVFSAAPSDVTGKHAARRHTATAAGTLSVWRLYSVSSGMSEELFCPPSGSDYGALLPLSRRRSRLWPIDAKEVLHLPANDQSSFHSRKRLWYRSVLAL